MSILLLKTGSLGHPLLWLAALAGLLVIGTLALWSYYGTTVFFELVRAGWAACF